MARVKFPFNRSILLRISLRCLFFSTFINQTSSNTNLASSDSRNIEHKTETNKFTNNSTLDTEGDLLLINDGSLGNLNMTEYNTNQSTSDDESEMEISSTIHSASKDLTDQINEYNQNHMQSTENNFEIDTNSFTDIPGTAKTPHVENLSTKAITITEYSTTPMFEHILTTSIESYNTLHNSDITTEGSNIKISTKNDERTSKVFGSGDGDSPLFQFWTTLSGTNFNRQVQTTLNVEGGRTENSDITLSSQLVRRTTTPSTSIVTENDTTYYDLSSPDNDLAKNSEDLDMEESSINTESTKNTDIPFDHTLRNDDIFTNQSDFDIDFQEAADYGMMKMNELYGVQEPKLYQMGLILEKDDPARYVAAFNWQSDEAKNISKFGYASLQAYIYLRDKFPDELESRTSIEQREEEKDVENEEILPHPPRPSPPRSSSLRQQCPLKSDPRCPPASKRYRTHDGTCNNLQRLRWGSALSAVQRFLPPEYGDGVQSVRRARLGGQLPSARTISETVHTPKNDDESVEAPVTHMLMQWGQFLDHDITSSSQARGFNGSIPKCCENGGRDFIPTDFLHPECLPIIVPDGDSFYGQRGIKCLEFVRSSPAPRSGCEFGYREQLNQVTAYIDGSPVYSSSAKQSDKLRLFRNGLLQYGRVQARRPVLPPDADDEEELCRGGAVDASCFKAGDGRVNEHPGLVAMHIVWLRKHNRLATELSHINPHWSDEKVYQETRKIIGALIQHITYREFLPIVLGSEVMRLFDLELKEKGYYKGYNSKINPNPANAFGAAAFRFGHSLVQDTFLRYDQFHRPIHNSVSLHRELTNPSNIWSFGAVDRLLLGLMNQPSQKRDEFISPELTNHLFQTPRLNFGMDLASINIQRGRDHGIPPYVQWREPCGLTSVKDWEDLLRIMPLRAVRNLESVYREVGDIDLFTGGMAERPVVGGLVGPTFACIIAQQFSNLRKGDRFWYENGGFESSFTPAQLQQIRKITLAQVLCETMENVETLQPFIFLIPDDFRNRRISCNSETLNNFNLDPWTEGNFNSDNDVSGSEIVKTKFPTNTLPHQNMNGLLDESFSDINRKTTTKKTITQKPINIDDKLDGPVHKKPTKHIVTDITNSNLNTARPIFTKQTTSTKLTAKPSLALHDKLDFQGKKNNNMIIKTDSSTDTLKRSFSNNNKVKYINNKLHTINDEEQILTYQQHTTPDQQQTVTSATNETIKKQDLEQKTFTLRDKIPFFNLLTNLMTTPVPRKPTRKAQIIVYQQENTTKKPTKYTYLINIVPKPTTPKYDNKEVVKITVQSNAPRPVLYSRPVYNNNKLEYRPIKYDNDVDNIRPQYNRPFSTIDKYDIDDNYRPVPTYLGSNIPINENQISTENNYYSFTTSTNSETTTKRYDLFHRPVNNYHTQSSSRPLASNSYNKPNNYQTVKPTTSGVTIYIDNKVHVKPSYQYDTFTDSYNSHSTSSEEYDNIPLFTRPNYNRPLLQKPLTDYINSKPILDNDQHYETNTNNYFMAWTQRPDPPNDSAESDYNAYIPTHKETPQPIRYKPSKLYSTPRPSHVSLHLASEYGNHKPHDISIVLNPLLDYKSSSTLRTTTPTSSPTKYFYVRNVLYKSPHPPDELLLPKTSNTSNESGGILKENYNNPWKPNADNTFTKHQDCDKYPYDECFVNGILKSKSNISPSSLKLQSKESDVELVDLPILSRKNSPVTEKQKTNQVFFEVIPSENNPVRWLYFKERQENNYTRLIMPQIASDPLASKELPRPIISPKIFHNFNRLKKNDS